MRTDGVLAWLLGALFLATAGAWVAVVFNSDFFFAAVGLLALLVVTAPVLTVSRYDLFSPWSFVTLAVFLGTTLRGVCISLNWPTAAEVERLFIMSRPLTFFVWPCVLLVAGLLSMSCAYWVYRPQNSSLVDQSEVRPRRLTAVVLLCVMASTAAALLYFRLTGGSLDLISAKRTLVRDLDDLGDLRQYGYLFKFAKLSTFAYLLLLGQSLFGSRRVGGWRLAALVALFLLSCAVPFYSSNRQPIAWVVCFSAALTYYAVGSSEGRRKSLRTVTSWLVVALLCISVMTTLRQNPERIQRQGLPLDPSTALESLVRNRSFLGIAKTAHIINAIPEQLEYQNGRTILSFLLVPIPRELWPGKPLVQPGPAIGRAVFHTAASGVPPGIVAELYWNFGSWGVLAGCAGFGLVLKLLYVSFRPVPGANLRRALLYVVGPMRLAFDATGVSIGYGFVNAAADMAVLAVLTWLVLDRPHRLTVEEAELESHFDAASALGKPRTSPPRVG